MSIVQQIVSTVPYGQIALQRAEGVYAYSKDRTLAVYNQTKDRAIQTKNNYVEFRQNFEKAIFGIAEETVNEVLLRLEKLVGVPKDKRTHETIEYVRERFQAIFQTFFTEFVLKNRLVCHKSIQSLILSGKRSNVQYIVPIYVSLKATILVTKQMIMEFIESRFKEVKLTYESSKDNFVMFVSSGNLSEQKLSQKLFEGIDSFKRLTIQAVNKGLEIRVDRQFLLQNFDKVALNLTKIAKEMKQKGEGNIIEMKKKSKDLYKQVLERIRAKQIQLRSEMTQSTCQLNEERQ